MYEDGLHHLSMFVGGYINFGFWNHADNAVLSRSQRLESERNLYRLVGAEINLSNCDKVLEIGCGLGCGTTLL